MSSLLHLLRSRTSPLSSLCTSTSKSKFSHYFSPSHSPLPRTSNLGLNPSRRPFSSYSEWIDNARANRNVLYMLMGLNVGIFGYGVYTKAQAQSGYQGPYVKFVRNMTLNYTDVVRSGVWWTAITSAFTHLDLFHLGSNMLTAYFLGGFLCSAPIITPAKYLTIALGAGLLGNVGFLYQRYLKTNGQGIDYVRGLGFSGSLMGLTSVAACIAPHTKFQIYGVIPVPLWGLCAAYGLYDGYYLNENNSRIGHAGHLGGLAFGLVYYLLVLRGVRAPSPWL